MTPGARGPGFSMFPGTSPNCDVLHEIDVDTRVSSYQNSAMNTKQIRNERNANVQMAATSGRPALTPAQLEVLRRLGL